MAALALGAFGSFIGSFLNVVIYRVPRGRSVVSPPSACGACGHRIRWYDNIPVVSWVLLRGCCRDCKSRISVRYPLVEFSSALFFALVAAVVVPRVSGGDASHLAAAVLQLIALLYLASISIVLSLIDIDVQRLPNAIVLPAYPVLAALLAGAGILVGAWAGLATAVLGLMIMGGFYLLVALIRPGAMGMGDVKLAGLLGLVLGYIGWPSLAVGMLTAFILGGVFGVILLVRKGRKARTPFGPWMLAGAWVGILWGEQLAGWYLDLFGIQLTTI